MTTVDLDVANAVINICLSLDKIAAEMERLNAKLDNWTYQSAVSIIDVG